MSELFTQELLKEIQEINAEKWAKFWEINETKGAN